MTLPPAAAVAIALAAKAALAVMTLPPAAAVAIALAVAITLVAKAALAVMTLPPTAAVAIALAVAITLVAKAALAVAIAFSPVARPDRSLLPRSPLLPASPCDDIVPAVALANQLPVIGASIRLGRAKVNSATVAADTIKVFRYARAFIVNTLLSIPSGEFIKTSGVNQAKPYRLVRSLSFNKV